eukprot:TRINITY_DN47036_c0_g1_i1.p2 TRINITY_DN47036_c0_g1~~TRINITY_DN47036_c0_g1_i1.p2  ORF type:complete len:135 (+),score=33.31 TRINITY_DN47036_c0_g1_i1:84-488(+)
MQPAMFFAAALPLLASCYPVFSPGNDNADTCAGIKCAAVECKPPFEYKSPEAMGTCCPVCMAASVKVPEDRSWAAGLTGGVAMNNNADPVLCRDVVCPPLHCPETEQMFDGRCCTKCKSAAAVTPADLAAGYSS